MSIYEESLEFHEKLKGKIEVNSRVKINNEKDLSLAYTPGVAEPCRSIYKDSKNVYSYTRKGNSIAVVSDGTAVLGLGDIGALASLPVMEGKSILFKSFADIDAFPIVLKTTDTNEIIQTIENIAPSFGGINLEDISAPRCFEIEERLKEKLDIPVFHDDQHGTAIVVLAALINSLKIVNKKLEDIKIVISGAGAAGIAIAKLLLSSGAKNIVMCNIDGVICKDINYKDKFLNDIAKVTNKKCKKGNLGDIIIGADVFIGVSKGNILSKQMVEKMNNDAIVFAMANPEPEIYPDEAKKAGARIVGTGRSDFCNQINNVIAFPGIFRGALDVRAREINERMKIEAAYAIANSISDVELNENYIIPKPFDKKVQTAVRDAVSKAAIDTKVNRI